MVNKCLISGQGGSVTASNITSDELKYLTGIYFDIKDRLDELAGLRTGLDLNYYPFEAVITSNYLTKWWNKNITNMQYMVWL